MAETLCERYIKDNPEVIGGFSLTITGRELANLRVRACRVHELMEALARQLDELVAADLKLPAAERHGVSLFAGLRPWEFSEFTKMRRGPRQTFG